MAKVPSLLEQVSNYSGSMELVLAKQVLQPVSGENVRIVVFETLCRSFALFAGGRDRQSGRIDATSEGARSVRRDGALIQHWHWPRENQLQAGEVTQESCVQNTFSIFVIYVRIPVYRKLYEYYMYTRTAYM